MIVDRIENRATYRLPSPIAHALDYMATHDMNALDSGMYRLADGTEMEVMDYTPEADNADYFEGAEDTILLSYLADGFEKIGYANKSELTFVRILENDRSAYWGEGSMLHISEGMFYVFFPQDCYMLQLRDRDSSNVRKISVSVI